MTYKVEMELKLLIMEAYCAGLNRETAYESLLERFKDIMEKNND